MLTYIETMANTNNDDMRGIDVITTEKYLQFPLHQPDHIVPLERHIPPVALSLHIPIRRAHKAKPIELLKALRISLHCNPGKTARQLNLTAALSLAAPAQGRQHGRARTGLTR